MSVQFFQTKRPSRFQAHCIVIAFHPLQQQIQKLRTIQQAAVLCAEGPRRAGVSGIENTSSDAVVENKLWLGVSPERKSQRHQRMATATCTYSIHA